MAYPVGSKEQRGQPRIHSEFPVTISIGTQLTVQGHLKDLSLKSAFIRIKNNIFLNIGDEIGFTIQANGSEELIEGLAGVSRIVPGEGLAIYFIKVDEASLNRIKTFLSATK